MADFDAITPLVKILNELIDGPPSDGAYVLNAGDTGLLESLEKLSAKDASAMPASGGASIAAHVEHLRYGLELMNRWTRGEEPFSTADWAASWERTQVSKKEWEDRLRSFRDEAYAWREAMADFEHLTPTEQNGVVGSVVHLAYHFGAIRQINRTLRGPSAREAMETDLSPQQLG